jgi:hypothetical protein
MHTTFSGPSHASASAVDLSAQRRALACAATHRAPGGDSQDRAGDLTSEAPCQDGADLLSPRDRRPSARELHDAFGLARGLRAAAVIAGAAWVYGASLWFALRLGGVL